MDQTKDILEDLQRELGTKDQPASERTIAKFLGVSHATVNNWKQGGENGGFSPSTDRVNELIVNLSHGLLTLKRIKAALEPDFPMVEVEVPADRTIPDVS